MKWTDKELKPVNHQERSSVAAMVAELETQPGRWAEIARYAPERLGSARSRGAQTCKRYPQLEYVVEREGSEFVLYFRVGKKS